MFGLMKQRRRVNDNVDFDINGGIDNAVCIENGYLAKMKDFGQI